METMYDKTFLNSLFKSNEFDFIEYMDSDIQYSDKMLKTEEKNRNLIVEFINELNDSIHFKKISQESTSNEENILSAAKTVFELINYNIDALQSNNELSNSVKKSIIDLLIKIDSDGETASKENYSFEISNLKDKIMQINSSFENIKTRIENNNRAISDFFNTDSVQKYLKDFSLEYAETLNQIPNEKTNFDLKSNQAENVSLKNIAENNNVLLVSEKRKKVYLPYSKEEVMEYIKQFPNQYTSFEDVVKKEFIFSTDLFLKHPVVARFRESYSLIRDREAKSVIDSFKYAMEMMFNYDLNPVIIAACKSQSQLERYLKCLESKNLDSFTDFEIKFEVSPLKVNKRQSF